MDFGFMLELEYADFHKTLERDRALPKRNNHNNSNYSDVKGFLPTNLIRSCLTSLGAVLCFALMGKTLTFLGKVTAIYVTLPLVAAAALLHFPVAWLIQRLYRRTSFSEALDDYRKQINCKPFTGPDAIHPRNQGLEALTLRRLWKHFERFSLFSPAKVLLSWFLFCFFTIMYAHIYIELLKLVSHVCLDANGQVEIGMLVFVQDVQV
jgi:hypothetical protein